MNAALWCQRLSSVYMDCEEIRADEQMPTAVVEDSFI
jgi:hypothetical protein